MFEVTLQEGSTLRLLDLHIIQSPIGIRIYHADHIIEAIVEPYFQDRDTAQLFSVTSPFPTDSYFEQRVYEAHILVDPALRALEKKYGASLYHWNGVLLLVAIITRIGIGYAIL
jgi:hypothetical protein